MSTEPIVIQEKDIGFLSNLFQQRWKESFERVKHERDEALAQVAVLLRVLKQTTGDTPLVDREIAAEARALLDRLQRAEAVVRDLTELGDDWIDVETAGFYRVLGAAQEVVAAWEEGKVL